jgi:cytochrome P450
LNARVRRTFEVLVATAGPESAAMSSALTFGAGPDVCLGMPLARMQTTVAICALLDRLPASIWTRPRRTRASTVRRFARRQPCRLSSHLRSHAS